MAKATSVVCPVCGAKMIGERQNCLRCGQSLAAAAPQASSVRASVADDAPSFFEQYRWWLAAMGVAVAAVALRATLGSEGPARSEQSAAASASPASQSRPVETAPAWDKTDPKFLNADRAGTGAFARGDFASAIVFYREAVEKDPNDLDSLNNLGLTLVRVGRAAEAVPYFQRATQLNQTNWGPRFNLGNAYASLNDWTNAIAAYRAAAAVLPDDYVTVYNLGLALHKSGDEEAAVTEFRHAAELAPGEPSFHLSMGISYERLKKPVEAVQAYEDYLTLAPEAPDAAQVRARIQTLTKPS